MAKPIPTPIPDDVKARFWAKVDKRGPDECWPWLGELNWKGYGRHYCQGRSRSATQVAVEIETGRPFPKGLIACHHCDNPPCVNPAHLFPGTFADNMRDAAGKGRMCRWPDARRGSDNPFAKLTEDKVRQIKALKGTASQLEIAARFGVSNKTICNIFAGRAWPHVETGDAG